MTNTASSLDTVVLTRVAEQLKLDPGVAGAALNLMREGNPIPFLARYRRASIEGLMPVMWTMPPGVWSLYDSRVIYLPYDLMDIYDPMKAFDPSAQRTWMRT